MTNTLVDPPDLADYPGAPFSQKVIDAAVANLRGVVGWHIAPEVTETITVDGSPDKLLVLPSLRIVAITAVRDITGTTPVTLTGYRINTKTGILQRDEGWPDGFQAIEVDLKHGYIETPVDLLPAVVWYSQQQTIDASLSSEQLGSWSEAYGNSASSFRSPSMEYPTEVIARYSVRTET
jgi:hypothetical protein